ncbi:MAG TPA: MFS transporter [Anaerolineales bacterium]|nr:MFS transporter [Anaerolineales bacterium]
MKFDQPTTKRVLRIIFFIMLMDIVGMSIIFPVAPYIVQRYSQDALMVTMLTVIYASAQFFAAPALGKISDRVGRRPVLLLSVFGSAIGYFIFGLGGALWVLFLSRLIDGITGGNISTASACIVDISKPEERTKNFTLLGMAYGVGFILGPALGGVLGQWNLNAPVYVAGSIFLVSTALVYFWLPESLPIERRAKGRLRLNDFNPFASVAQMAFRPKLGLILLILALFNFSFDGVNSVTGVFIKNKFATSPLTLGLLFVFVGVATAFVQGALIQRLVPRYGEKRMALVGLLGSVIGWPLVMSAAALWMLFPITFLQSGITGFIWATTGSMAASYTPEHEQGQLAGVNVALSGLMSMLGPLWAGAVYDKVSPNSPFWMGSIILLFACLLLARVKVRAQAQPSTQQNSFSAAD